MNPLLGYPSLSAMTKVLYLLPCHQSCQYLPSRLFKHQRSSKRWPITSALDTRSLLKYGHACPYKATIRNYCTRRARSCNSWQSHANIRNSSFSSPPPSPVQPQPHQNRHIVHQTYHLTDKHSEPDTRPLLRTLQLAGKSRNKKKIRNHQPQNHVTMSARPPPPPAGATPKPKPSTSKPSTSKATTTPRAAPRPRSPETHLSFNRRNLAAEILQSYEQLAWYALARNEVSSKEKE